MSHPFVEIQQLDTWVLGHVLGSQRCGGLEGGEPGREGDRFDGFAAGEVGGYGRDEGVPGAWGGVDDVVVVEVSRGVGGVVGGEDEVDDYVGRYVNWDPGYGILTWDCCGDFAKILGACYDL